MKPTKQLIRALREAANALLTKSVDYNWSAYDSCNCGILAQFILNLDANELQRLRTKQVWFSWTWTIAAEHSFCGITKLPVTAIFIKLYEAGLEYEDFHKIEFLSDDVDNSQDMFRHQNPILVAKYFNKLADKLEERRKEGRKYDKK